VPVRYPKEQMHRIKYTKLTPEQIGAKLAGVNGPASVSSFSNSFAGDQGDARGFRRRPHAHVATHTRGARQGDGLRHVACHRRRREL
jgi:hypothetical protein